MHVVLLVHSHSIYRAAIRLLLAYELGLRVIEAADTHTALLYLEREQIDLIIQGTDLPDKGELRIIKHAKKYHPDLPVLLLATHHRHRVAEKARRLGVYIVEPEGETSTFLSTIHSFASASVLQKANLVQS